MNSIDDITPEEWDLQRPLLGAGGKDIKAYYDSVHNYNKGLADSLAKLHAQRALEGYKEHSDGASADYYTFPKDFSELQDLISYKNMNAQIGEIFRACYRYGEVSHSPMIRDIKKIIFYAKAELKRLESIHAND